jgi:hypothetical protein
MPPALVDDELWELIQPLLPRRTRRYRHPGRRRIDDRKVLTEILFVLTTGPNTDPASAANAGSSSAPSPGSTSTGAYDSATNAAPTSAKPSSASPASLICLRQHSSSLLDALRHAGGVSLTE